MRGSEEACKRAPEPGAAVREGPNDAGDLAAEQVSLFLVTCIRG